MLAALTARAVAQETDPTILDAIASVSSEDIDADVRVLAGVENSPSGMIESRFYTHPHHAWARDYLIGRMEKAGLSVALESFDCGAGDCANLIVELPGEEDPGAIWLVGAHYDSTNGEDAADPAPGAVDNASGTSIVLQTLTILSQYRFRDTIRFVLFDAEEVGLVGSTAHATAAEAAGEDIRLMFNIDVPGWRVPGINAAFASSDWPSWPDLQQFNALARAYPCGTTLVGVPLPSNDSANMRPFWNAGYRAFMLGSLFSLTGKMNTADDVYAEFNLEQNASDACLTVAYLAERAGILDDGPDDDADDDDADDDDTDDDVDDDADDDAAPDDDAADDVTGDDDNDDGEGCGC